MQADLEAEISDLLLTEQDPARVAQSLFKRLKTESPNRQERITYIRFMINAGQYQSALTLFKTWFAEKRRIPFSDFLYLLHINGFKPSEKFLNWVEQAQYEMEPEDRIQTFFPWEDKRPFFEKLRQEQLERCRVEATKAKEKWKAQVTYYQTNRMIAEEEKLLNMLLEVYPDDVFFLDQKKTFKERWARATISQHAFEKMDESVELNKPVFNQDEMTFADNLEQAVIQITKKKPHLAYNFSLCFYFMELYEHARRILLQAHSSPAVDWFYAELLLQSRRFIECLDALYSIETKYASDPETTFATTYYRALALDGLGHRGHAHDLLKSLVTVRPSYRSAHELLIKWGGLK